jgi:hypothetical protein
LLRAARLSGTEHGYIYLLEPGDKELQIQVGMGFFKSQLGLRVKPGEGMGSKNNRSWSMTIAPGVAGSVCYLKSALSGYYS